MTSVKTPAIVQMGNFRPIQPALPAESNPSKRAREAVVIKSEEDDGLLKWPKRLKSVTLACERCRHQKARVPTISSPLVSYQGG